MTAAYSEDLRKKIVESYEFGEGTQQEVADIYRIHLSTFKRIYKQHCETGSVKLSPSQAGRPARIDEGGLTKIREFVLKNPDATLVEIKNDYKKRKHTNLSLSIICHALQKLNLRRKKKSIYAQEQEREDIKKRLEYRETMKVVSAKDLVFIDESGANLKMYQPYARAIGGERIKMPSPLNRGNKFSIIGAICYNKVLTAM